MREPELVSPPVVRYKLDQRLTAEEKAQLVASYQAGSSTTQLVEEFQLSKGSVVKLLHETGIKMRGQSLSPADLEAAVELYQSGLSLAAVGKRLGFGTFAVRNAFLRHGVRMRPRCGWNYDA